MTDDLGPVTDLLADNLGQLHNNNGDPFMYVPLLHDSPEAKQLRHDLAECITLFLNNHGWIKHPNTTTTTPDRYTTITCALCSTKLLTINTNQPINARLIIEDLARRQGPCPHNILTPDHIRQKLQDHINATEDTNV